MSFLDKLGAFAAGASQGAASIFPAALQARRYERQEARYERRLDFQEMQARKQAIRNLLNSSPGNQEVLQQALAQAEELGDPSFVAELKSAFTGQEAERLRGASRQLASVTAGQTAQAMALPFAPESVADTAAAVGNIAGGRQVVESLAGVQQIPSSRTLESGEVVQGIEEKSPSMTGVPLDTRTALFQAEQAGAQLNQRAEGIKRFEADRLAVSPFTPPDELSASIDRLKESFLDGGGTKEEWLSTERRLRRELLADRQAYIKDALMLSTDSAYLRGLKTKWGPVDPGIEALIEGRARRLDLEKAQDVTPQEQFAAQQTERLLRQGYQHVAFGQLDLARDTFHLAAESAKVYSLEEAAGIERSIPSLLKEADYKNVEQVGYDVIQGLSRPGGMDAAVSFVKAAKMTPAREDFVTFEEIWRAAAKAPRPGGEPPPEIEGGDNDAEIIAQSLAAASSDSASDRLMLQFETIISSKSDSTKRALADSLIKRGVIYDPGTGKFFRGAAREGVVPPWSPEAPDTSTVLRTRGFRGAWVEPPEEPSPDLLQDLTGLPATLAPAGTRGVMKPRLPSLPQLAGRAISPKAPFISARAMRLIKAATFSGGVSTLSLGPMVRAYQAAKEALNREPTLDEILQTFRGRSPTL